MEYDVTTPAGRIKIYQRAIELLNSNDFTGRSDYWGRFKSLGVCQILECIIGRTLSIDGNEFAFPEWHLLRPNDTEVVSIWWEINNRKVRRYYLEWAIALCS